MQWMQLLYVLGAIAIIALIVWTVKRNPQAFSAQNLNRSFFTLGVLALLLIGFIAVLVFLLR